MELDDSGQIVSYEEYYPYGSTSYQAGRSGVEVSSKRYRYTGKERNEETGFTYHGARYYAPWVGRWTSADPAELTGGVTAYEHSRSNPIRFIDPDGRQPQRYTEDQPEEDPWNRAVITNALQEEVNQAQRGTRKYRYASERLEAFKETGWDPGPRVNIEGGPAPVNIAALHAANFSTFLVPEIVAFQAIVSGGEAITGRSFGVFNPGRILNGNEDDLVPGRKLSVEERVWAGVGAALGLGGAAWAKWSTRTGVGTAGVIEGKELSNPPLADDPTVIVQKTIKGSDPISSSIREAGGGGGRPPSGGGGGGPSGGRGPVYGPPHFGHGLDILSEQVLTLDRRASTLESVLYKAPEGYGVVHDPMVARHVIDKARNLAVGVGWNGPVQPATQQYIRLLLGEVTSSPYFHLTHNAPRLTPWSFFRAGN